jgi:hypothetical protein
VKSTRIYSDEELYQKALEAQTAEPKMSESAVMSVLGVGREYLANRAKDNTELTELRSKMAAIREHAWIEEGIKGMPRGKDFNATVYIWMTRNILGWRDKTPEEAQAEKAAQPIALTPDLLKDLIKSARTDKDAA